LSRKTLAVAIFIKKEKPMRPADFVSMTEMTAPPDLLHVGHADSPFGRILLAASETGLSHVWLDEDGQAMARMGETLSRSKMATRLVEHRSPHHEAALAAFTANPQALTLHVKGTPFQLAVWRALLDIPFGRVSSYKEVAAKIGKANANRAVGSAVGKNPVFFIIPCHRVLAHDGGLGGYFWGLGVKSKLLDWEQTRP
jgi:AraC family transcriptional regulator of adaptative response/methylated-DNA-[protein]-cysteine methyltransferase